MWTFLLREWIRVNIVLARMDLSEHRCCANGFEWQSLFEWKRLLPEWISVNGFKCTRWSADDHFGWSFPLFRRLLHDGAQGTTTGPLHVCRSTAFFHTLSSIWLSLANEISSIFENYVEESRRMHSVGKWKSGFHIFIGALHSFTFHIPLDYGLRWNFFHFENYVEEFPCVHYVQGVVVTVDGRLELWNRKPTSTRA